MNWQIKKLGDVCGVEIGKTPSRSNKKFWDPDKKTGNVWLSIADLSNAEEKVVSDGKEYISDKGAEISKIVKKGTLLVSFKLTLGRLAFAGRDLYTNEAIAALNIKNEKEILSDYLYYYLSFFDWDAVTRGDVKIKGKTLNKAKLKELKILYPESLTEQKRIVSILDEVFAGIEQAKENTEQNLKNSRELFKSYLQGVFEHPGERWENRKLEEISKVFDDGDWIESKDQSEDGIRLIQTGNIGVGVFKDRVEKARYITKKTFNKLKCTEVLPGDVLISRLPEPVGRSCVVLNMQEKMITAVDCTIVRFDETKILPNYFNYYTQSKKYLLDVDSKTSGTTRKRISRKNLGGVEIPLIQLKEQRRAIKKLDQLSAETKKLEGIYKQKLADLEELKKSVLQSAFAGNL